MIRLIWHVQNTEDGRKDERLKLPRTRDTCHKASTIHVNGVGRIFTKKSKAARSLRRQQGRRAPVHRIICTLASLPIVGPMTHISEDIKWRSEQRMQFTQTMWLSQQGGSRGGLVQYSEQQLAFPLHSEPLKYKVKCSKMYLLYIR